jgi:hypothetical protein
VTEWTFTLQLDRAPTDAETDALYEAGLDDALITGDTLTVDRVAPNLLAAVISAVTDLHAAAGPHAVGVRSDQPDAVTLSDIAARLAGARTTESLRLLAAGKRGPGGFPAPTVDTGNIRVYSWAQVAAWLQDTLGQPVPDPSPDLALADQALKLAAFAAATDHASDIHRLFTA